MTETEKSPLKMEATTHWSEMKWYSVSIGCLITGDYKTGRERHNESQLRKIMAYVQALLI